MARVFRVTQTLEGCNPIHVDYPLLEGDILVEQAERVFMKTAPGLAVGGFSLSDEECATLVELPEHPPIQISGWSDFLSK